MCMTLMEAANQVAALLVSWIFEPNIVLSCDFLKCFDRIEFQCITEALKQFSYSEYLIQWIEIMYTKFNLKVQNNGKFSRSLKVERGVHQGGPASNGNFFSSRRVTCLHDQS